jgi:hypothetical protein
MILRLVVRATEGDARAGAVPQSEQNEDTHQQPDDKRNNPALHDELSFRALALVRSYHNIIKITRGRIKIRPLVICTSSLFLPKVLRGTPDVFDDDEKNEEVDDVLDRQEE